MLTYLLSPVNCSAGTSGVFLSHPGEAAQVLPPVHQQQGAEEVRHLPHIPCHLSRQGPHPVSPHVEALHVKDVDDFLAAG